MGIPFCEVKGRVGRNTGRVEGSVALHLILSPFPSGLYLGSSQSALCGVALCGCGGSWFGALFAEVDAHASKLFYVLRVEA